jgi:protein PhnA
LAGRTSPIAHIGLRRFRIGSNACTQLGGNDNMDIKVRDSNGALLAEGDTVTLIKDLKLKGSSTVLKRGTVIKNIHLTDDADEIEGRTDKVKGLVLRTEFLKKA